MLKPINYYILITSLVALSRPRRHLVASEKKSLSENILYIHLLLHFVLLFLNLLLIYWEASFSVLPYVLALIPEWIFVLKWPERSI